jgi:hypothetical protein
MGKASSASDAERELRFQEWAQNAAEQPPPFRPLFGYWTDALREKRDRDLTALVSETARRQAVLRPVSLAVCVASQRFCFTARVRQFLDNPRTLANPGAGSRRPFLIEGYVPNRLVIYDGHSRLTAATFRRAVWVWGFVLTVTILPAMRVEAIYTDKEDE